MRKKTFTERNNSIKKHNQAGNTTHTLQLNPFADWVRNYFL